MKASLGGILIGALVLSSCGTVRDSRFNPFNWFGGAVSRPAPVATAPGANPLIPTTPTVSIFRRNRAEETVYLGQPIAVINELLVERRPGGAIVRTTGIASQAGPFDVRLTLEDQPDPSALVYTLNALQRPGPRNTGPDARKVTAATYLSDNELIGISRIEVRGAQNILTTRR
ncbi:hypothetical protein ROJ8625_01923 [Roseivivax jejudonensis]|uniref:Lipoprotein n=1 Tax=Roseivivax jejudonensis TaxID=1529041 RepID=A0A1X6Z5L7_9RHOB|nr:hypothetical protein [Roseivivax jejudonensis]SLN40776.1 hypothetical protein ROJ8625_01923 [Roseivivax jejudonensis]